MDELKLAWAAGIFDGEGCINSTLPKRFQIRLEVKMTHKPTLELFGEILGCKVGVGYEKRGNRRPQYRVRLYQKKAIEALEKMLPYLVTKKDEANLAIYLLTCRKEDRNRVNGILMTAKRRSY